MRTIARRTLREFVESRAGHKDQGALKAALDAWFDIKMIRRLHEKLGISADVLIRPTRTGKAA